MILTGTCVNCPNEGVSWARPPGEEETSGSCNQLCGVLHRTFGAIIISFYSQRVEDKCKVAVFVLADFLLQPVPRGQPQFTLHLVHFWLIVDWQPPFFKKNQIIKNKPVKY